MEVCSEIATNPEWGLRLMANGELLPEMEPVIADIVRGMEVYDLGAGDLTYAKRLLQLGADRIVAVDKEGFCPSRFRGRAIHAVRTYFQDVQVPPGGIEVAWVSWPCNRPLPGLTRLLAASARVIYMGCNTGGSCCGELPLWDHLTRRRILAHVPHMRNSLIVYGDPLPEDERRPLVGEELAYISGEMMSFDRAQATATEVANVIRAVGLGPNGVEGT